MDSSSSSDNDVVRQLKPGKIFVGGLANGTTKEQLVRHFHAYGEITNSIIIEITGDSPGFGFIGFADPSVVDKVMEDTHVINGKQVEIKRTLPKGVADSRDFRTNQIFVGGIPSTVTEDEFIDFFKRYGEVIEHQIIWDHSSNHSRCFGSITFDSEESVDDLLAKGSKVEFAGVLVEISKTAPPLTSSKLYNDSGSLFGDGYGHREFLFQACIFCLFSLLGYMLAILFLKANFPGYSEN